MIKRIVIALMAVLTAQAAGAEAPAAVRAQARDIFQTVIGFKTSEGFGQVPVMAEYLAGKFRAGGFPAEDVHVLPIGDKAALVVRYRGSGKGGRPIVLLALLDVVTA